MKRGLIAVFILAVIIGSFGIYGQTAPEVAVSSVPAQARPTAEPVAAPVQAAPALTLCWQCTTKTSVYIGLKTADKSCADQTGRSINELGLSQDQLNILGDYSADKEKFVQNMFSNKIITCGIMDFLFNRDNDISTNGNGFFDQKGYFRGLAQKDNSGLKINGEDLTVQKGVYTDYLGLSNKLQLTNTGLEATSVTYGSSTVKLGPGDLAIFVDGKLASIKTAKISNYLGYLWNYKGKALEVFDFVQFGNVEIPAIALSHQAPLTQNPSSTPEQLKSPTIPNVPANCVLSDAQISLIKDSLQTVKDFCH